MVYSTITREQALEIEKKHIDYCNKLEEKYSNIEMAQITKTLIRIGEVDHYEKYKEGNIPIIEYIRNFIYKKI